MQINRINSLTIGSFAICNPYKVQEHEFNQVKTLGRKGSDSVDLSLITVLTVASGEPLNTTASPQPIKPIELKSPFDANRIENIIIILAYQGFFFNSKKYNS